MRRRRSLFLTFNAVSLAVALIATSNAAAAGPPAAVSGFRVLTGRAAAAFRLPTDVELTSTWRNDLHGLTYERYQQFKQPFHAHVEGAQLTVVRRAGAQVLVIGAHYPSLIATNLLLVDANQAIARAHADGRAHSIPQAAQGRLQNRAELRIDPIGGRLFQRVESFTDGVQVFTRVDAETGAVLDSWDALAHEQGKGTGVHGDRKDLRGPDVVDPADDLTRQISGKWVMQSMDGRVSTYDARRDNHYYSGIGLMSDNQKASWANDNDWQAKYQRPAVDAQFYSDLTDDWYRDTSHVGGFDFEQTGCETMAGDPASPLGPIRTVVHFDAYPFDGFGYDNAFWDGAQGGHVVFGDGDGVNTGPFSGGQDVVSHELTHAVTQCRSLGLAENYYGQTGALNEALSDMMAVAMEWSFNEPLSSNCRRQAGQQGCPDWWVGEDVMLSGDFGFRNLADPESAGQPGHWQNVCKPASCYDNGGVHINSTIPSHAFYLAVNGGRNARCAGPSDLQQDCDVVVPAIGLADATEIFFDAWATLTESATFCEAHEATVAAAEVAFPGSTMRRAAVDLAWAAVGRGSEACGASGGLTVRPRSLALAAGGSGVLTVTAAGSPSYSVSGPAGVTFTVTPTVSGATVQVDVAADLADGAYPIDVAADNGVVTRHASAALIVDSTPPTVSVDSVGFATVGEVSGSGALQLVVDWSASDAVSGLADAHLQSKATNAPDFANAGSGQGPTNLTVGAPGYSFRVTAEDVVGNTVTSAGVGPWLIGRYQEDAATYHGSWSGAVATAAWGSVRFSKTKGAWLDFNFTGTDVAWISSKGPKFGKAKVYVDDVLVQKVDLWASSAAARRVAFAASGLAPGAHKLTILVLGTTARPRIDVDGFATLSQ